VVAGHTGECVRECEGCHPGAGAKLVPRAVNCLHLVRIPLRAKVLNVCRQSVTDFSLLPLGKIACSGFAHIHDQGGEPIGVGLHNEHDPPVR
jgi:hypothetical protein